MRHKSEDLRNYIFLFAPVRWAKGACVTQKNGCGSIELLPQFLFLGVQFVRPSRQNMFQAVINRMVHEALMQKHEAFVLGHQYDTDEQLLQYSL